MSEKYALYEISYVNALMYSRAVPMPNDGKDENNDKPIFDETKDMNNPDNFEDFDNEEVITR